jgi:hypothetical protein
MRTVSEFPENARLIENEWIAARPWCGGNRDPM